MAAAALPPTKRRRSATTVLAGDFDPRPPRDVLTSLLNGVPLNKTVESGDEPLRARKRKESERDRDGERAPEKDRKRVKPAPKPRPAPPVASTSAAPAPKPPRPPPAAPVPKATTSSFWQARPAIHIATMQRSVSVTPPPMPSSPPGTPPSVSSVTSGVSSRRPHTPFDDEDLHGRQGSVSSSATPPPDRPRKRRAAVKKGWKGWVEGSPPPSEKLINLDSVVLLPERKTRSGKNFDAIGLGKETWV